MEKIHYLVTEDHQSEFPEPIVLPKGAVLVIGEKYDGPEDWIGWFFCETPGQKGGWVPEQIIQKTGPRSGYALEDYSARELNVSAGHQVWGGRELNGWLWCERPDRSDSGWVPLSKLQKMDTQSHAGP